MHKDEIDIQIATSLGVPRNQVKKVTQTFIDLIRHTLVVDGEVRIPRLGILKVREWEGETLLNDERLKVHKTSVTFKRATLLEEELKERQNGKVRSRREYTSA